MTLDHFQGATVDFSILTSLQTIQILQKHNRKAIIFTEQCHLISVLEVTKLSLYFCFRFPPFFSLQTKFITFPFVTGSRPDTEDMK